MSLVSKLRYRAVRGNSIISSVCFCFFYHCEIWTRPMETTSFYSTALHYFVWMRAVRMPIFSTGHEFSLSWFYNIQPLTPNCSGAVCIAIMWMYKHTIAIIMKLWSSEMKVFLFCLYCLKWILKVAYYIFYSKKDKVKRRTFIRNSNSQYHFDTMLLKYQIFFLLPETEK